MGVKKPTREKELRRKKNWESSAYEMKMEEMVKRREEKILRLHLFIDQRSSFPFLFSLGRRSRLTAEFSLRVVTPAQKNLPPFLFGDWIIIGKTNSCMHDSRTCTRNVRLRFSTFCWAVWCRCDNQPRSVGLELGEKSGVFDVSRIWWSWEHHSQSV